MKKLLSAVFLLVVICIAAGCSKNEIAETTTVTTAEKAEVVSLFQKKFEITDWTMEELVSNMTVCGKKVPLPCTLSELSELFTIKEFDFISGATGKQSKGCEIYHDDQKIAFAYCDTDNPDSVTSLCFDDIIGEETEIPEINIMGITQNSSAAEIIEILGEPNVDADFGCDYRYYFSDNQYLYISFNEEQTKIEYIAVEFS